MNFNLIDSNLFFMILRVLLIILGIGLVIYGIITWLKRANKVSARLEQFVSTKVQPTSVPTASRIIPREISGSLFSRTIISWFHDFLHLMGRFTPEKLTIDMEHKLTVAGKPSNLRAGDFFAIRILVLLAGIIFAFFVNRNFNTINKTSVLVGLLMIGICLA